MHSERGGKRERERSLTSIRKYHCTAVTIFTNHLAVVARGLLPWFGGREIMSLSLMLVPLASQFVSVNPHHPLPSTTPWGSWVSLCLKPGLASACRSQWLQASLGRDYQATQWMWKLTTHWQPSRIWGFATIWSLFPAFFSQGRKIKIKRERVPL